MKIGFLFIKKEVNKNNYLKVILVKFDIFLVFKFIINLL